MEKPTFEEIPSFLVKMMEKMEEIITKMDRERLNSKKDVWLSVKTLSDYIPNHPSIHTIYGWTHNRVVPFHKKGKSVLFLKSEIDNWMDGEKVPTKAQLRQEAIAFIQKKNEEALKKKYFR